MVAHFHGMEGVRGSNPLSSTRHETAPDQRKRGSAAVLLACPSSDGEGHAVGGAFGPVRLLAHVFSGVCESGFEGVEQVGVVPQFVEDADIGEEGEVARLDALDEDGDSLLFEGCDELGQGVGSGRVDDPQPGQAQHDDLGLLVGGDL